MHQQHVAEVAVHPCLLLLLLQHGMTTRLTVCLAAEVVFRA